MLTGNVCEVHTARGTICELHIREEIPSDVLIQFYRKRLLKDKNHVNKVFYRSTSHSGVISVSENVSASLPSRFGRLVCPEGGPRVLRNTREGRWSGPGIE